MKRSDMLPKNFILFLREAELASMSLCAGLTALRKANPSHTGFYTHAFFSISTGIERLMKLILIIDYAVKNNGFYPDNKYLRKFGHNIIESMKIIGSISNEYGHYSEWKSLMDDEINIEILNHATEFAIGARYSNLDELTNNKRYDDPIRSWNINVGDLILKRYPSRNERSVEDEFFDNAMDKSSVILIPGERGEFIESFKELRICAQNSEIINKYGMRHLVSIIQMLSTLLVSIRDFAQVEKNLDYPFFHEFFIPFNTPKEYWKNKKSWSPYY